MEDIGGWARQCQMLIYILHQFWRFVNGRKTELHGLYILAALLRPGIVGDVRLPLHPGCRQNERVQRRGMHQKNGG